MKKLEDYVVSIPDYPEPGIIFRDVTSILQDAEGLKLAIDSLQAELDEANAELERRKIAVDSSGSMAEAALKLNGIFESAQNAAEQYLENVRAKQMNADETVQNAEEEAQKTRHLANLMASLIIENAKAEAENIARAAKNGEWKAESAETQVYEVENRADELSGKLEALLKRFG